MRSKDAGRGLILFLTLAAAGGAAFGQQKYRFQDNAAVGDVSIREGTMEMSMDIKTSAGGQELGSFKFAFREREESSEEVLAVAGDRPSTVRRTYELARAVETLPDGAQKQTVSSLQGKVVTIRIAGDKVTVSAAKGKIAPEDEKSLVEEFRKPSSPFFPDRELAPGEEWNLDPQSVAQVLPGINKGEVKGKFEEVVSYSGRQCAQIGIEMNVEGKPEGLPVPLTMKGSGKGYYAVDLMRPLDMEMSGPVAMKGEVDQGGVKIQFDGQGTMVTKDTRRWVKVAGKPVAR